MPLNESVTQKMDIHVYNREVSIIHLPKILYIEDNAEARSLVGRLMAGRYVMLEANDSIVGLELAQQTQPDLILLDMNLPNMNGLDVARRLLDILKPGTPILALSADSDPEMRERAMAAGFSGFVNKPIDIDRFYELLNGFLHDKHEKPPNIVTASGSLEHRGVRLSSM